MKKLIVYALALILAVSAFAACGKSGGAEDPSEAAAAVQSIRTVADAIAFQPKSAAQTCINDNKIVVYAFETNGHYWRLIADVPADVSAQLAALDITADDIDEKQSALIAPLTFGKYECLDDQILPEDALKALTGKTGADLLNDGWVMGGVYTLDETKFEMEYGVFLYEVVFETGQQLENADEFDEEAAVRPLKVKSVTFAGFGDPSTVDVGQTD